VIGPKASYDKPKPQEAEDFLALIKAFRKALDKLEGKTGQRYFLTAAVNAAPQNMQHINYSKLHKHMDWINLMSYDYDGTWDNDTGHHSPLNGYKSSTDPDFSDTQGKWNTRSAVEHMLSEGVPSHKLVIGMPLYARGWSNVGTTNNGLFQQTAKAAPGEFEDGIVGYNCLMEQTFADTTTSKCDDDFDFNAIKHTHTDYNGQGQYVGVYYYNPETNLFYSYDDAESIQNKADFVENYDLGGGMFWSLDGDAPQEASFPSLVETFHHSVHDKSLPKDAKQWIQNKSN
jgi:chitinase